LSAIAADQYMLASPIRVNNVSTPSAAKACANTSETWLVFIAFLFYFSADRAAGSCTG
jgi:hypothetical protein